MIHLNLVSLLEEFGNLLRDEKRISSLKQDMEPTSSQILGYLSMDNRYKKNMESICGFVGRGMPDTLTHLDLLERDGYIKKFADTEVSSKENLLCVLTDKGREFVEQQYPPHQIMGAIIDLDPEDRENLNRILTSLLASIQRRNKNIMFNSCGSCMHFIRNALGDTHLCALTNEPLREVDVEEEEAETTLKVL